jgi:TP901 family phage tail tape measure protein
MARASSIDVIVKGDYNDKDIKRAMADLQKMQAAGLTLSAKMAGVGRSVQSFGKGMERMGGQLTRNVTLPIVGLGGLAVKAFADFDSAMTQSLAIMGDVSEEQSDRMQKAARQVATSLNLSHKEAAESFFFLASAGLDAEQSIAALPRVAAFAKAGMFDMATATDLATDAQSALGMTVPDAIQNLDNLTRVTDVFVKANTLANATVEEFAAAMTEKAGASLRLAGKDIEEGTAVLAVFADQGIKGSRAGTTLARTLEGLQMGALKNADAFSDLNIAVFDADGAMRPMVDIVRDMESALGDMTVEEQNAALAKLGFSKQARAGILALLGNSEALGAYEDALRDAGGTVDEVANKQLETFNEKLGILGKQFMDIAIEFGPIIIDQFLVPLGDKLRILAEMITNLTPQQREMIVQFAGIAAIIGPVLLVAGKLISMVGGVILIMSKLALVFNPIGLAIAGVIVAVALFALGIKHLWENSEDFRAAVLRIWDAIKQAITTVVDAVKRVLEENAETVDTLREAFATMAQFIMDYVVPIVAQFIANHLVALIEFLAKVVVGIVELVAKFAAFVAFLIQVGQAVATFVSGAVTWFNTFRDDVSSAFNDLGGNIARIWNGIFTSIEGVLSRVKSAVRNAINFIISGWNRLSFSVPSVSIGDKTFGGFTIGVPQITPLALGGIVTAPTLALIGEAGPEAVLPLTGRNAAAAGIGQSSTTTINLTVNAGMGTQGAEVGRAIVEEIRRFERVNGPVFVGAA